MVDIKQIQIRLAEAIRQSGMTQTKLATELHITQSAIAHYISGDIMPSLDTFASLCKILDVDTNYILCQDLSE